MFVCYICRQSLATVVQLRAHLQRHKVVGDLRFPILCSNCKSSFATIYNFIRHVSSYHSAEAAIGDVCEESNFQHTFAVGVSSSDDNDRGQAISNGVVSNSDYYGDVCAEGVALVAGLRANSSIPYSIIPPIVDSFNQMSSSLTAFIQGEVMNCLVSSGVSCDVVERVHDNLADSLGKCSKPLEFLDSGYKQDKYFNNHPFVVVPESVAFGCEIDSHSGSSKLVYESFQYVSVRKTLHSLMQNAAFVELLLHDNCHSGVFEDFADGEKYKTHKLFSDSNKMSVMIQLFYDGLGVTNPLRGQSVLHNVGAFFYSIRNLPNKFNSCFANVHLLALCYSQDLKKYGFNPVLQKFVAEINDLSRVGFEGSFPIIGKCTVYASLCQVTCDNLALNGILGFIESFSCDYFCTLCYATQRDIQTFFREEQFRKRTLSEYDSDIHCIEHGNLQKKNHKRGVKAACKLNDIDGFHVTDNWCLDIMHVLLEGIVPYELGCILHALCSAPGKCLSFETVNRRLHLFWGKINVEKTHKPLQLNNIEEPGQSIGPSMKAVQHWALLKYMPLVLGNLVSPANKHWQFLLHLSHLVDLIFAPRILLDGITYMRSVIEDHLAMFVELYGSDGKVRLRPKHHFLVHLPTIVLKCGPLTGMSCMRYELKNSFFKRSSHIVCNFTNICHTLAYRHQQRALYSLLSNAHVRNASTVMQQSIVQVCTLPFSELLVTRFGLQLADDIAVARKLCVASTQYVNGNYVAIDENQNGDLVFGKIVNFVSCIESEEWFLVVEEVETVEFSAHFHSYCVSDLKPKVYKIFALEQLIDHHPLYCHSSFIDGVHLKFVRLPYHIFKL